MSSSLSIHLLHNSLRLHDNPPLYEISTSAAAESMIPLYIITSKSPFSQSDEVNKVNKSRANFCLESLEDFDNSLKAISPTQRLICLQSKDYDTSSPDPDVEYAETLKSFLTQFPDTTDVTIYYERDTSGPILRRWRMVLDEVVAPKDNVSVKLFETNNLHPLDNYLAKSKGNPPNSYGSFCKIFNSLSSPAPCLPTVATLPPPPKLIKGSYDIPKLDDLENVDQTTGGKGSFKGGETEALKRLELTVVKNCDWAATFEKPKTSPNSLNPSTTLLSPYVKHGCISPRLFYHKLSEAYEKSTKPNSSPPVSLHGQLLWREYNYLHGYATPNFDKMVGNPSARQIQWDDDPALLKAWKDAETGFPFIDAIMTQLKETGWIHHLARHMVACFLTRGDLYLSWEEGAKVFEERLVDADWSINNFNWQWLSCTAHFYQYFRCYSPIAFGKKTDPNGDYIRKWIPALAKMPKKYIYEPWEAPLAVQQAASCIVGKDYPNRIVENHTTTSKNNMSRIAESYKLHKEAAAAAAAAAKSKKRKSTSD
ncbi:hypothetical protein TrVE_jg4623 [Triparma verrucosa]|uniref:Photolyase/cryptochrome alpha/beta domain-containing protein n=1 Tax=Triparma verrucosa TaxID=1606542 RepID=A0A9W7EZZ9_9STRA|nr:hypothetical protein TrVE_jg4623 [Triparma verrucosa]